MQHIHLDSVDSTNNYIKAHAAGMDDNTVVDAREQTAGRGQRGNRWLTTAGKNATFSILLRPKNLKAADQQIISEVAALATAETLTTLGIDNVKVKWPNDIYVENRKIAGILIECSLAGPMVDYAVVGIGLNVNQTEFDPSLPNPTSIALETGRDDYNPQAVMRQVCELIQTLRSQPAEAIHARYVGSLYRHDGLPHPFLLPDGTPFMATIDNVSPTGTLRLRHADGTLHDYDFKEVIFV